MKLISYSRIGSRGAEWLVEGISNLVNLTSLDLNFL